MKSVVAFTNFRHSMYTDVIKVHFKVCKQIKTIFEDNLIHTVHIKVICTSVFEIFQHKYINIRNIK